ncbi:hypothetical protein [Adhaeribacter pallidiroseus]|uniref:Uncharacterized protein n=1 Tax=Adhaeribacter pallidiroseus TaxID=2072847 RepID=A0A369QM50_9BACT|nr:hypothetical protein [Adhaeribacter pallidiroseus]RDC63318.1 hypothetical protein AHMF7616_01920 [Adhaeribacter pallidiroseus]
MSITKIKQIEDLKVSLNDIKASLAEAVKNSKEKFSKSVGQEYEDFFKGKGFIVDSLSNFSGKIASYGTYSITLKFPNSDFTSYKLDLPEPNQAAYLIKIFSKNIPTGNTSRIIPQEPDQRLNAEIQFLQEQIFIAKKEKENASSEKYYFQVTNDVSSRQMMYSGPPKSYKKDFESFTDLLQELIKD